MTDPSHTFAAPAVQRTRRGAAPTFDPVVVRLYFDDDRVDLIRFKTSRRDLRKDDASPRKPSYRLADKPKFRGVERKDRGE